MKKRRERTKREQIERQASLCFVCRPKRGPNDFIWDEHDADDLEETVHVPKEAPQPDGMLFFPFMFLCFILLSFYPSLNLFICLV